MKGRPVLYLAYETVADCRARLERDGLTPENAAQVASYLAQSTDIAADLSRITDACAERGIAFEPVPIERAERCIAAAIPGRSLVWTLTDGIAYYRGSAVPALARLHGIATFGADDALFALCQDKFRSGAVMRALGLPAPAAGLARAGEWIAPPPPSASGYFVKPNRLGSKIGIWADAHCSSTGEALAIARRIHEAYRDDAIVQPYLPGRNLRASFLAVDPAAGPEAVGTAIVESDGDFQTMAESLALYGETGQAARAKGNGHEPLLRDLAVDHPAAARAVRGIAHTMMRGLALRDVFSIDLRLEDNGTLHIIEFEVAPGLPCFDFRAYCRHHWHMELADAVAEAAARRLVPSADLLDADAGMAGADESELMSGRL